MQNNQQATNTDEEVGLIEVIQFFINYRTWIAACALSTMLGGAVYILIKPVVFEAHASIQSAMVAGEVVEATTVLNEKIKLPLYFSTSTLQTCASDGKPDATGSLASLLKTKATKTSHFLYISVNLGSAEQAKACLTAVLTDIQIQQGLLVKPLIQKQQAMLDTVTSKLNFAEEISKFLVNQNVEKQVNNKNFAAAAMMLSTSTSKEREIKELRSELMALETALSPAQTSPTSLAAPIYAPATPSGISPWLVMVMAFLLGVVLGVISAMFRAAWPAFRARLRMGVLKT
jgi:hypothetical protein